MRIEKRAAAVALFFCCTMLLWPALMDKTLQPYDFCSGQGRSGGKSRFGLERSDSRQCLGFLGFIQPVKVSGHQLPAGGEACDGTGKNFCPIFGMAFLINFQIAGAIPESGFSKDSKWGGIWRVTLKDSSTKNTKDTK